MSSNNKTKQTNGKHSVHHAKITKDRLTGKSLNNMTNNSKAGKNKNVDLGMTEESE